MSKYEEVTNNQKLLQEINLLEKEFISKQEEIKRKYLLNILMTNYFLSEKELNLFINYLKSGKISYLYQLKDIYLLHNIQNYHKKKEMTKEIIQIIAKENNLPLDLKKNKKILRQHLELAKYQNLK